MGDKHPRKHSPAVRRALASFAGRLRELRDAAGISQSALGDRAGVHWTTIFRYEKGKKIPTLDVALALAEALDVTVDGLTDGKKKK